jgi:hypothetical protein
MRVSEVDVDAVAVQSGDQHKAGLREITCRL